MEDKNSSEANVSQPLPDLVLLELFSYLGMSSLDPLFTDRHVGVFDCLPIIHSPAETAF